MTSKPAIETGIDSFLLQAGKYRHLNMGIVTNHSAATASGMPVTVALMQAQCKITRIFSPEHGITVRGEDGLRQEDTKDPITGLPVTSLYGAKLSPSAEDLQDLDLVLFDIPDVGARCYTYLWTMTYVMESCAQFNKPLIILDRPNPIGAALEQAEGPMLDEKNCASFIGRFNIPLKHACTLGELALYFTATRFPNLNIQVEKVPNYQRHQTAWRELAFTPTSPAIQRIQAAMCYPGTCLLEGVQIHEGRGTAIPFEQFGAPWIHEDDICEYLQTSLQHVRVLPAQFTPSSGLFAGQVCRGARLSLVNPSAFMAVSTGITILKATAALYPDYFRERLYHTHANPGGAKHLDKLLGCPSSFDRICRQDAFDLDVADSWFQQVKPFLLYS